MLRCARVGVLLAVSVTRVGADVLAVVMNLPPILLPVAFGSSALVGYRLRGLGGGGLPTHDGVS